MLYAVDMGQVMIENGVRPWYLQNYTRKQALLCSVELGSIKCNLETAKFRSKNVEATVETLPKLEFAHLQKTGYETNRRSDVQVYCEMGLNGGGYTFLNPQDLPSLTNDEVQAMFTDKNSFLMRVRRSDNTQPYGVLTQLPQYQYVYGYVWLAKSTVVITKLILCTPCFNTEYFASRRVAKYIAISGSVSASTPTSPAVVGLQLVGYTRLRRCKFTDWLLQHCSCWCTKDSNGQVTACFERCCAWRHRHLEVWPRPGSDTAWRTSLARRPWPGVFQAGSDSSPVSERPRTAVPVGLLCSGRRCRHSAAPAFRQPSTAWSTSLPAQHLRPSGLLSCRLRSLELSPGFHLRPDHQCILFQTFA